MGDRGRMTRAKVDVQDFSLKSGRGVPKSILDKIAHAHAADKATSEKDAPSLSPSDKKFAPRVESSVPFSELSMKLNLDEYEFPDDEYEKDSSADVHIDVTALDRYNEDIRKHRKALLDDCRLLPLKIKRLYAAGDVDHGLLGRMHVSCFNLARSCYYGTYKAHSLTESTIPIFVWLISRKNVPFFFIMKTLQSVSEVLWTGSTLKNAFIECHGILILTKIIRSGMIGYANVACWATYTMLTACIGCAEAILIARGQECLDEFVGEMTFAYYWRQWPANFGLILQGVLYSPNTLTPQDDGFEFW